MAQNYINRFKSILQKSETTHHSSATINHLHQTITHPEERIWAGRTPPAEAPGPGRSEECAIPYENRIRKKIYKRINRKNAKKLENNAETWYNFGANKPVLVRQRFAVVL